MHISFKLQPRLYDISIYLDKSEKITKKKKEFGLTNKVSVIV